MPRLDETLRGATALGFANALLVGDYGSAHAMLSAPLQAILSAEQMEGYFVRMTRGAASPSDEVEIIEVPEDWRGDQDEDVGEVYVAMSSAYYVEAVTVLVSWERGRSVISEIIWGRP